MRTIDVLHLGQPSVIACYQVGDAIVDPGPEACHRTLLEALGDEVPARILLTHIHLDHAGATGALVRHWPDVEVWVHERGARHVVDPSKLVASATRLYGDDMKRLWGEIVPVPERNLRVLEGGERIGDWRIEYTPGHASHHVSYFHQPTRTAFVGDTGGIRIDGGPLLAPTPPPDIDLDAWHASLRTIAAWHPARIAVTHFGCFDDAAGHIAAMHDVLNRWGLLARDNDDAAYQAALRVEMCEGREQALIDSYLLANPPEAQWGGLARYWAQREDVGATA